MNFVMPLIFFIIVGVVAYALIRSQRSDETFLDVLKAVGVGILGAAVALWDKLPLGN